MQMLVWLTVCAMCASVGGENGEKPRKEELHTEIEEAVSEMGVEGMSQEDLIQLAEHVAEPRAHSKVHDAARDTPADEQLNQHLGLFMGTQAALDTVTYSIPHTISVVCNTFPQLNGQYALHTTGTWNTRCVWYKDATHMIFFNNEGKWAIAERHPLRVITTALPNTNVHVPPVQGWRVPVVLNLIGRGQPPADISLLFHPVGRWQGVLQGVKMTIAIEDTVQDDTAAEGMGYAYVDDSGAHPLLPATVNPPTEDSGCITATWVVMPPSGDPMYLAMTSPETIHVMGSTGIMVGRDQRSADSATDADLIAQDILKQLFHNHFTKPVVMKVTGCTDSQVKGKKQTTAKCSATQPTMLTITGRNFGKSGGVVWLLKRVDDAKTEVPCADVLHDAEKPSEVLTCKLPPLEMGLVLDVVVVAPGSNDEKFESVLYGAVKTETAEKTTLHSLMLQDFEKLGVGGLGPEFQEVFRRAFASRLQSDDVLGKLGIRHVRGVVLHGPPGTGKTLLAKRIGEILGASKVHTVSGPEVMSKYVGQSESNLRKIFDQARTDAEDDDGLHLIIFDEMDAIMYPRGSGDDSGARAVYDGVTTQLLTLMDGIDDRGNLLVLGLTNRLDAVDQALLRPGRFEVKIKVPLPDENGRHEIFIIQTKALRASHMLAEDVDLKELAVDTPSYTGADIEGVVKSATSHALMDSTENHVKIFVSAEHFRKALGEVLPSQGSSAALAQYLEGGVIHYDDEFSEVLRSLDRPVHRVRHGKRSTMLKVLIEGEPGSGLTTVASYVAKRSGFPFVHLVSVEDSVGATEAEDLTRIRKVFESAYLVDRSCIIIDKLELLLERTYSKSLQHALQQLLAKKPVGKGRLLVLVTTNSADTLRYMGLGSWDMMTTVPYLDKNGMEAVFQEVRAFEDVETAQSVVSKMPLRLGVKKLLWLVEQARVMLGIDEDVHKVNVQGKFPLMRGRTQYMVPPVQHAEKEGLLFTDVEAEETSDPDPDLAEMQRLAQAGFIHQKVFVQLLEETGLLTSKEGLPTATGTLML